MLLECELCGAHYRADIADAHVQGGRLTFTCRSCGREVVVVGDSTDRGPRDAVLLFDDQGDGPGAGESETLDPPPPPAPDPAPAPEPVPVAATARSPEPSVEAPGTEPMSGARSEDRGLWRILLGVAVLAASAFVLVVFVLPMLNGPAVEEAKGQRGQRRVAAPTSVPSPPAASTAAPPVTAAPEVTPSPGQAPTVEIRELAVPTAKPTAALPAPRKELGPRDAAAVLEAAAIQEAVGRVRPFCRLCAVTERRRDPDSRLGTVNATLTIAPDGSVTKVVLDRSDILGAPLGPCVTEALSKMTFPRFDGAPVVLRQPIDLDVPSSR